MAYQLIEPATMLRASCILLGLWGVLSSLQWWVDAPHWLPGGARGWDLHQLRQSRVYNAQMLSGLYPPAMLRLWIVLQLTMSLLLIAAPLSIVTPVMLAVFGIVTVLLVLRAGGDGADKMALVVTVGAFLQSLGEMLGQPLLMTAGWLWVGGQLIISYVTSGVSKLLLSKWRNGSAPQAVFASYQYGHRFAYAITRKRSHALALAWVVMAAELLFPLALFSPLPATIGVLGFFLMFHFAIALVMGLNTYPWAFLAAYPSVLLMARAIQSSF